MQTIFLSAYSVYADKQLSAYTLYADNKLYTYTLYADKANLLQILVLFFVMVPVPVPVSVPSYFWSGPWSRSHHISGPGPVTVIFLVPALVPVLVKFFGPNTPISLPLPCLLSPDQFNHFNETN